MEKEEKTVKVRILPKVSVWGWGVNNYYPGDVVEIPERLYESGFMEKIEPLPEPEPVEEPVEVTVTVEEPPAPEEEKPAEEPKPRKRRKQRT